MKKKSTNKKNKGLGRIGVDYKEARKSGFILQLGQQYFRQKPLKNIIEGRYAEVSFAFDVVVDCQYAIISADELQPSHLGSIENPLHFIPEAQPRNRAMSESGATVPIKIAENLRPSEICEGSTAYAGCPVINQYGEVIQGSGRGYTMKYYWENFSTDPRLYTSYLNKNKSNFGFESNVKFRENNLLGFKNFQAYIAGGNDARIKSLSQLRTITNPVLVRIITCTDDEAIKLGQYKQSDLEALSTKTNEIKSRVNLIDDSRLSRVLDSVFAQSKPDDTLSEIIRGTNLLTQLIKLGAIRSDQLEEFEKDGNVNKKGVEYVSDILLNLIFKGQDNNIPEIFAQLPFRIQNAIIKATPMLLRVSDDKSIRKEVSMAIIATRDYLNTIEMSVKSWEKQTSMFGNSPKEVYSDFERKLVEIFTTAKTQSEIVSYFDKYNNLVADTQGDLLTSATQGISKKEAIEIVFFGIKNDQSTKIKLANAQFLLIRARHKLTLI